MNRIPGFGTWKIPEETAGGLMRQAYALGYRHFDTAAAYLNEAGIGEGLSTLPRAEISVTGKLWNTKRNYDAAMKACKRSLSRLQLDYFDQYLIHWPATAETHENWRDVNSETWRALEDLSRAGLIRHIGLSNFAPEQIGPLAERASILPYVNQIEFHPGCVPRDTARYCREAGIRLEAWSPLGSGALLTSPLLIEIGGRHGKTPAQICLKWCLQHQALPITRSVNPQHMQNNLDVLEFSLTDDEMLRLDQLHE